MSQIGPNPAKTANAQVNPTPALGWDVFVTPGIPIVTRDLPPGVTQAYFQAMASTLIYGARDAVLVDAFMTVKQANALADWVAAKNKNLTTIYITHGHGDHWFGVGTLLERFPNAKAVAMPNAVKVMRQNASPEFLRTVWKAAFPGQIPDTLVIAEELKGNVIDLEGQELVAVELGHTDTDHTTCLNVPSIGLVVAGDAAYNDVHLYLAESNAQKRQEWISALDKIESLNPRAVVASHKRPENDDNPQDHRRDPAIHPRFRPARGKDDNRSGALRQDAGALSEPGQSRMGALEFSTRSQATESDRGERKMTEAEVLRTHVDLFNGALKSRDWDQLAAIYSDDYMLVRPDGSVLSKQEVLKDLQVGGLEFKEIEIADVKVRIHGDTAILTAVSRTVTSRQGKETKSHIRLVAVYVADQSRPRLVHFQSVSLAD